MSYTSAHSIAFSARQSQSVVFVFRFLFQVDVQFLLVSIDNSICCEVVDWIVVLLILTVCINILFLKPSRGINSIIDTLSLNHCTSSVVVLN